MMSVKKAEPKARSIVTVIKNIVGPSLVDPVRLASQYRTRFTKKSMNSVQPTQTRRIQSAMRPEPALTSATESARSVQPTISLPTPAESTTIPTVVSRILSSVRIRQRTGNAVIEYATPVKSMKLVNLTLWSMKVW